jgi:hypothetical protein
MLMSRNLPIALATGLALPVVVALIATAQEPKKEAVPPPPVAARPGEGPKRPIVPGLMKAQAPPDPARPATPPPPPAPPTEPTPVALDFPGRPIAQVIRTLAERTGGMVDTFNTNDARWTEPVTLTSPGPVPFWEAIDRLTAAANLTRTVAPAGPAGIPPARVQFSTNFGHVAASASAADEGLVAYVGPFRVGPLVVHEHFASVFHPPSSPAAAGTSPPEPFYAEINLTAEPNLLATQVGPLRRLEVVDDAGQSLLDHRLGGEAPANLAADTYGPPRVLRVPLVRGAKPSKSLATLRGALPLEVARRPTAPTLEVPLEGSAGKTVRDGELAVTVREYRVDPQGQAAVKLTIRLEGPRAAADPKARGLVAARLWSVYYTQIEMADARSRPVRVNSGGANHAGEANELNVDYTFSPFGTPRPDPPTRLRIYRPTWVAWDLPLEFRDVPLP